MSWVLVDDHASEDERFCAIGGLAAWYHSCAHGFCRRKEHLRKPEGKALDFVPEASALGLFAPYTPAQAKACVAALLAQGLWARIEGGYQLTDYAKRYEHAPSSVLPPHAGDNGGTPRGRQLGGKARVAGASRTSNGTFAGTSKPPATDFAGHQQRASNRSPTGPATDQQGPMLAPAISPAKPAPRASDPVPDPEPIKQKAAAKDLSGGAREPASVQQEPAAAAAAGSNQELPSNLEQALDLPICARAAVVVEHTERAEWLQPHKWPEVLRVATALHEACGLGEVRVATYSRDSGVRAIVELFAAGYMPGDLVKACRLLPSDAWWAKDGARRGLASLSPEVVRRVLATGLSPAQEARVARAVGDRAPAAPSALAGLLPALVGGKP